MEVRPIPIDSINIGERQRSELGDINDLATSIRDIGLLHPIVVTRDSLNLMAGFRRLSAARLLGWTAVPVHFFEELSPRQQFQIEFAENEKRSNLTWEERARAIHKYHMMSLAEDHHWTQAQTGKDLGLDTNSIQRYIAVHDELDNPQVKQATSIGTASNIVSRLNKRREADKVYTIPTMGKVYTSSPILHADFNTWAESHESPKFNLLHIDFPYGINAHLSEGQHSALDVGYTDSPETFWTLFKTLSVHLDNFCAPSAHCIFWFSPNIYADVQQALKLLDGFRWDEHPLIWMRGENEGIAPDPNRRPRRCYEMAFFGWRGDRPLIKTKANIFQAPTTREDHPHEKSEAMLRHFFEMVVDTNTRLLDPTCGSGSALRAATALGAAMVLGLEANNDYAEAACRAYSISGNGQSSSASKPPQELSRINEGNASGTGN